MLLENDQRKKPAVTVPMVDKQRWAADRKKHIINKVA